MFNDPLISKLRKEAKPFDGLFVFSLFCMFLSGLANILPSWLIKVSVDGLSAMNTAADKFSILPKQLEETTVNFLNQYSNLEILGFNFDLSQTSEFLYISTDQFTSFLPLSIIVVFGLDSIFKFSYLFSIRSWGLKVVKSLREKFHKHLNSLSLEQQSRYDSGSLVSVVSSDMPSLQSWLSESITNIFNDGFKALFLFSWLLIVNYKLTLIAIFTLPIFAFPVIKIGKKIRKYSKGGQDQVGQIGSFINESLVNQKIIKAFNLESWRQKKFLGESKELYKSQSNWFLFMSLVSPITNIIAAFGISAILFYGLKSVNQNSISLGEFSSFFVTCILLFDPIKRIGRVSTIFQSALGVAERIYKVLDQDTQEEFKELEIEQEMKFDSASVDFKDINFRYESLQGAEFSQKQVFENLSVSVPAKTSLALVGPSGSGKTSLVSLLLRFYEINSGQISINGQDVKQMPLSKLRAQIALVSQEPLLFSGSLRENLALNSNSTEADMNEAIDKAFLTDVVSELKQGLDFDIGERGQNLSIGQRQRVALARAFLSKAPVVVLDEPTSALDNKSQQYVYKSIQNLMKERTVIIIAHRLDTVKNCDQIAYIEHGELKELGTYEELVSQGKDFAALLKN